MPNYAQSIDLPNKLSVSYFLKKHVIRMDTQMIDNSIIV